MNPFYVKKKIISITKTPFFLGPTNFKLEKIIGLRNPEFEAIYTKNPLDTAKQLWINHIGTLTEQSEIFLTNIFSNSILKLGQTNSELLTLAPFRDHFEQFALLCDTFLAYNIQVKPFPLDPDLAKAKEAYENLKLGLQANSHPKHSLFNVRSGSLFKWCYTAISELVFEPFKQLFQQHDTENIHFSLSKIGTKIAIFNTYLDDIADNIQDVELTVHFCKIPTANVEELQVIRDQLATYEKGIFLDFFNTAYSLWEDIHRELKTLLRIESLEESPIYPQFQAHILELMNVMMYSVSLNNMLHSGKLKSLPNFNEMEFELAPNMMVKILFDIQRMALVSHAQDLPENCHEPFNKMTDFLEKAFHHSNSFATYKREIHERDITNSMFKLAEIKLESDFNFWKVTHCSDTLTTFIESTLLNEKKFSVPITSFLDLFINDPPEDFLLKEIVLSKLTESKQVISAYFAHWRSINDQIELLSQEIRDSIQQSNIRNKEELINSFQKFRIHNEIFLGFRILMGNIISTIKNSCLDTL